MGPGQVVALDEVLDRQLPVRRDLELHDAAQPHFAEIEIGVAGGHRRHVRRQRDCVARHVDEDQAVPGLAADRLQVEALALDHAVVVVAVAAEMGGLQQPAVQAVAPRMIRADHCWPAALRRLHQDHPPMTADIVEGLDAAVALACDDDGTPDQVQRHQVTGIRQAFRRADERPAGVEHVVALQREKRRVGIGVAGQPDGLVHRAVDRGECNRIEQGGGGGHGRSLSNFRRHLASLLAYHASSDAGLGRYEASPPKAPLNWADR
jgi:hypothetical protein